MRNKSGHFQKGNTEGFVSNRPESLKSTITVRLTAEDKKALKNVPNWQERLRDCIHILINKDGE
ncbi:MAG: hypothetical protein AAFR83_24555 [Cyanobacteria bacterium J06629_18]